MTDRLPIQVAGETLRAQVVAILRGWRVGEANAEAAGDALLYADLNGIDTHGAAMMVNYDSHRRQKNFVLDPIVRVVRETPVLGLVDGGDGLGHRPARQAMDLAIAKCAAAGIGAVGVRRSWHFGAAGYYALMAAERGFVGIASTAGWNASVVPTFGAEPILGTNPIAFAAPARRNPPFLLDMATSTVAAGKMQLAMIVGKPIPEGWATDEAGRPETDAAKAWERRWLTPLGGTPEMSSHKGYGLGMMVDILCATLSGAMNGIVRLKKHDDAKPLDTGHFFMAIDPAALRGDDGFRDQLDEFIDTVRATKPIDPRQPVLIAGDPERRCAEQRKRDGVPVPRALAARLRAMAEEAGAPYLLEGKR